MTLTRKSILIFIFAIALAIFFLLFTKNHTYGWLFLAGLSFTAVLLTNIKYVWLAGILLMPVSKNIDVVGSINLTLPSDIIALALWGVFLLRTDRESAIQILKHPIMICFGIYFGWMVLCTIFSSMPVVSLKYTLSMFWYVTAFLWASIYFFRNPALLENWPFLLSFTLIPVVFYTIIRHAGEGFSLNSSYEIMQPFYKEHTAYATSIALMFPYFFISFHKEKKSFLKKTYWGFGLAVITVGIITIYTRGAWLGVSAALGIYGGVILWERFRTIFYIFLTGVLFGLLLFIQISLTSSVDKGENTSLSDRLLSAFNTKTDLSNMERINRWVSAASMMNERPLFGFGPGTYAMQYAPYQQSSYRTYVSTNLGKFGTAHNEFLLAGSEMGYIGLFSVFALYAVTIVSGLKGYFRLKNREKGYLYLMPIGALTTYFVHAFVNNYLDQDKIAIPAFLCWAQLIALDLYENNHFNSNSSASFQAGKSDRNLPNLS